MHDVRACATFFRNKISTDSMINAAAFWLAFAKTTNIHTSFNNSNLRESRHRMMLARAARCVDNIPRRSLAGALTSIVVLGAVLQADEPTASLYHWQPVRLAQGGSSRALSRIRSMRTFAIAGPKRKGQSTRRRPFLGGPVVQVALKYYCGADSDKSREPEVQTSRHNDFLVGRILELRTCQIRGPARGLSCLAPSIR